MTDYFKLYLKYKNKYLQLKGGASILDKNGKTMPNDVTGNINAFLTLKDQIKLKEVAKPKNDDVLISPELTIDNTNYDYFINKPNKISVISLIINTSTKFNFVKILNKIILYPNKLTHLTFGNNFNQPIEQGVLPQSLTHLTFDYEFNQPIEQRVLPQSLTQLTLANRYLQINSLFPNLHNIHIIEKKHNLITWKLE